jgi:hypothetical protein
MFSKFRLQGKYIPVLLIVSAFVLQVFFFAPLHALVQNFGEFSVPFFDVLLVHLTLSFGLILGLYLVMWILELPIFLAALTFFSVIAFIESRFFQTFAQHNVFDGKTIDWQSFQWLSYIELATFLLLGVLFVLFRKRVQLLSTVSIFILMFLTLGFFYDAFTNSGALLHGQQANERDSLYLDQFYRLSNKRNVIHIVPDQAQGALLHDILVSDYAHYSKALDGFTLFSQAVGRFESTYPSVAFYMSGESPEPEADLVKSLPYTWDYIEELLSERSILTVLSQNSFKTFGFQFHPGMFCKGPYTACTGTHEEVFAGVAINNLKRRIALAVLASQDLAFFQTTPLFLRRHVYDDGRWFVKKLAKGAVTHSGILDVFMEKMQVDDNPGTYNYFHHAGAHAPILFDRDCNYIGLQETTFESQREQVKCTLEQINQLIRVLKKNGVYDETMIVVNGDHGTPWLPPSFQERMGNGVGKDLMGRASTLLLIKPPGARGELGFSNQEVTIGDIPATIAATFGIENSLPGVDVFKGDINPGREREYFTFESASKSHSLQSLNNLARYRIRGNIFNERDWVLPGTTGDGRYLSQLRMDHAEFETYAQGFSYLEQHDFPVRWVNGTQARVFLSPPIHNGLVALEFECFVPPGIEGQSMIVKIDGQIIKKLEAGELVGRQHSVRLPGSFPGDELLEIEFTMGKTLNNDTDERRPSVLFSYIGLVPAG